MTTALHTVRSWWTEASHPQIPRLVKVDLTIAVIALLVIVVVIAVDHADRGTFSALAALLGG